MDDDVAVLPDGLDKLDAWSDKAEGYPRSAAYDFDGGLSSGSIALAPPGHPTIPLAKAGFGGVPYPQGCNG